ncbi:MAG: CBS domain-containing protein [Alphaproteobacteria bacterium]
MQAKDVMTTEVVVAAEDTPVHEIVGKLIKHRISGMPVVDALGRVVGIVSEGDLLQPEGQPSASRAWWLEAVYAGDTIQFKRAHGRTAGAIMTKDVVTVGPDTPLAEIARLIERKRIKRVPVVTTEGELVGIVSRANLLHGLADAIVRSHEPDREKDRALRTDVLNALKHVPSLDPVLINVTVAGDEVRLWGQVETKGEIAAAEKAVKNLDGVSSVVNNLGLQPPSGVPV